MFSMEVSKNGGTSKSSKIHCGFCLKPMVLGTPILRDPHMVLFENLG